MQKENTTQYFDVFWEAIALLQQKIGYSFVEALGETLQNFTQNRKVQQIDNQPSIEDCQKIELLYQKIPLTLEKTAIHKLIQYAFLKAAKQDKLQANHAMTPDAIALLMAFIINTVAPSGNRPLKIGDFAVGSANLLLIIQQFLNRPVKLIGSDNDEVLVHLASQFSTLQQCDIQLLLQDSLRPLYVDLLDIAVSDLPVGYYPDNDNAKSFKTASVKSMSYAHHLLIEQHLYHLAEGGFGVFVVPSQLFETEEASQLLEWLKENAYIQAFLQLPPSLFQHQNQQKSLLMIQKYGESAKQANPVLLGTIPNIKNQAKLVQFTQSFKTWAKDNGMGE